MTRIKLTLAYTGTAYAGWQAQSAGMARGTIQSEVEKAIAVLTGAHIRIHGAGRTDAGVHAEAQAAHFDPPETSNICDWRKALNANLPGDIRILEAVRVPEDFDARRSATGKRYAYTLYTGKDAIPPRLAPYAWGVRPLDVPAMHEAAALLAGRHDFASFRNVGTPVLSTTRTLYAITEEPGRAAAFLCPPSWPVTTWFFEGDGFLKQMVRNLMGLLVWVGEGKIAPAAIPAIREKQDRKALPSPAAPPQGLTLMQVMYAAKQATP